MVETREESLRVIPIAPILARMTLPPGFSVRVSHGLLTASLTRANACGPGMVTIDSSSPISERWIERDVALEVLRTLDELACHENREWLRLDGKYVEHPHPELLNP